MAEKIVESVTITPAENGGFTIRNSYKRAPRKESKAPSGICYDYPQSEDFVFGASEGSRALAHISKACKIGKEKAAEDEGDEDED